MENKYLLTEIMTIPEAAERYGLNVETLKNKFKTSIAGAEKINDWVDQGLIRKSGKTWLITPDFVEINFLKKKYLQ